MPAFAMTYVLGATIFGLVAAQVPLPVEMTALVMVGLVLRYSLHKDAKSDSDQESRITRLEDTVLENRQRIDEQRHLKHAALNRIAGITGMLMLLRQQIALCTCGAMGPLLPVVDQIIEQLKLDGMANLEETT